MSDSQILHQYFGSPRSTRFACRWIVLLLMGWTLSCSSSLQEQIAEIRALQAQGRYDETVGPVVQLFDRYPDDLEVVRLYGVTMLALDYTGLAVWPLRELAEHPEAGLEEYLLLTRALRMGGAKREAFDSVAEVLAVSPDHGEGLMLKAGLALELKKYQDVLDSTGRLLEFEPRRSPMTYVWRAKAFKGLDRLEDADEALASGLEALSSRPDIVKWRQSFCPVGVEILDEESEKEKVTERWNECLQQFPANDTIVSKAVGFFERQKNRARVQEILEEAIAAAPRYIDYRIRLARHLAAERRFEESEVILLEATQLEGIQADASLALANYYRDLEEYDTAAKWTERAIQESEEFPHIWFAQLGDDYLQSGQIEKAGKVVDELDEHVPEYASLLRGRMLLIQDQPEQAIEELRAGLRLFQGNATARYLIGEAFERLGKIDLAIEEYRSALRTDPTGTDAAFALARLYEAEANFSAIHRVLNLRLQRAPKDTRALEELARLQTEYGAGEDWVEGVRATIERLAELPGQETGVAVAEARLEARLSGPKEAAATLQAHNLDLTNPLHVDVLRALVRYLNRSGQSPQSLEWTNAAREAHSEFAPFHEVHAEALEAVERPDEEITQVYRVALELDSESARALFALGQMAEQSGRTAEALEFYDRATAADPDGSASAWSAVQLALSTGREEEVDRRLNELLVRNPTHANAMSMLARRLLQGNDELDIDRAESLSKLALRYGGNLQALTTFGLVALERGQNKLAIRAFQLALKHQPNSASTRYQLARAFSAAGNSFAARTALRRALAGEDFPEAVEARAELARLEEEDGNVQ